MKPPAEAMNQTMTAWGQDRYGGPEVVRPVECPVPAPGPGEVLIEVACASLNSADVRIMRGDPLLVRLAFGLRRPRTPIPGRDIAGTVVAVHQGSSGVPALLVGDRVVGELSGGGLAPYVAAPADRLVAIPDGVDVGTAAALPLASGTAWQALDLARVGSGSRVLVLGAGGGVGTFAVRLAVLRGAEVHALCSARAIGAVRGLGAARVEDRSRDLATLPSGGYDAVIDLGGRAPLRRLQRLVSPRGYVVGVSGGENRVFGPLGRMARAAVLTLAPRGHLRSLAATNRPEITEQLLALAASGDLAPVIDRRYGLDDAGAALAHVDAGGLVGKVLVQVAA